MTGEIEVITDTPVEREIHWKIPDFFSLSTSIYHKAPDFKFLNVYWLLQIDPYENDGSRDNLALLLKADAMKSSYDVVCTVGIKKVDGSMMEISSFKHPFSTLSTTLTVHKFFTRSALSQSESELLPLNCLTIICNLKLAEDPIKLTGIYIIYN